MRIRRYFLAWNRKQIHTVTGDGSVVYTGSIAYYYRQGGYVLRGVCLSVSLLVTY